MGVTNDGATIIVSWTVALPETGPQITGVANNVYRGQWVSLTMGVANNWALDGGTIYD